MSSRRSARAAVAAALALAALAPMTARASVNIYVFTRATGPGSASSELLVPTVIVPKGGTVTFVNGHLWGHSLTSDAWKVPDRERLFTSDVIPFRRTSEVRGVESLEQGEYGFFCRNHQGMRGTLVVV